MNRSSRASRNAMALGVALAATLPAAVRAETLAEAWQTALQQDRSLAAAKAQAEAAGLQAEAARAQRWPTVAVNGSYTKLDDSPAFDFSFTGLPIRPPELFPGDDYVSGAAS